MTINQRKFVAYYRQFGKVKAANSLGTQKAKVAKFLEENTAAAKRTADAAQKLKKSRKGEKLPIALGDVFMFENSTDILRRKANLNKKD